MTTEVDLYNDPALEVLYAAAESVHYHFKDCAPRVWLEQMAWEWRVRHPLLVEKSLADNTLRGHVQNYLRLLAQQERARQRGYHPDDQVHYSPAVVARMLPDALETGTIATSGDPTEGRGSGNPHGQGDYLCTLIDVRTAWLDTAFRQDEAQLIRMRYIDDLNFGEIAETTGHPPDEVKARVAKGLRRMVELLGGWRGRECPSECPDHEQQKGEQ